VTESDRAPSKVRRVSAAVIHGCQIHLAASARASARPNGK
jgi:hypothetical protein